MRFTASQRAHLPDLDLTAMIDVIFLLIIFFMTTAQFVERARAELDLPKER
ncbi:MAG: biopolymer transporter ExbD, partial [Acidobacteria bacterium]|nr:biopolymer transporter ExbD [Acidobacteriota bacterium]